MDLLRGLGYQYAYGPDIAPNGDAPERADYGQVVLLTRLQAALRRINPAVPESAIQEAVRKVMRPETAALVGNNRALHQMLTDGVDVSWREKGRDRHGKVWLIETDPARVRDNDLLVVNQFTVVEDRRECRPDIVIFVNGLPLGVIELKNPLDTDATIGTAFDQIQRYKREIPSLMAFNEVLAVADGLTARLGTLTSDWEWFLPWRTVDGKSEAHPSLGELKVLLEGAFAPARLLDLIAHFIVFEDAGGGVLIKKMAGYHQYHAVQVAVEATVKAARPTGDKRVGVVWHTQGSGKSLTMVFYAGQIIVHPAMANPTLVVITDRNDLDEQLFGTFARCQGVLRQNPVRAQSREHLRELLTTTAGGVVFTTVQKFFPPKDAQEEELLSDRRNIVVIADEAHRSQYDFVDGFARHMREALPGASFIGFTGTPIALTDKNTRNVFGDYVSVYDIEQAVLDGATVRIYYESRLARLELREEERPRLDDSFEEVTEGEEVERKERLKTKWAQLEALVGSEARIGLIAGDLVKHFEDRLDIMDGKAMIVCMSRRICVELYNAIKKLRPQWHQRDDEKGVMKVVMTGSGEDPQSWKRHVRAKSGREELAKRFKDPKDPLRIVIVRDMWLTGFDVPCMHTMYLDKPMRGHGLMQAIARVNRVFKDKPGGLVVDYLGLADQLRKALANYTQSGGKGQTAINQEEAVAAMRGRYEVCCDLFHGFDWSKWKTGSAPERLAVLPAAQEHVLAQSEGKERLLQAVTELSRAFALAVPDDQALAIRDDVGFFQAIRAVLTKNHSRGGQAGAGVEMAIRQIVSRAVASDEVIDIFAAAGLNKPNISILSEEFLAEVKGLPQRNLAVEMLRKLLEGEIKAQARKNVVQARSFAGLLEQSVIRYRNRAVEAAQVIEEMIALAREMREADRRGETLGLSTEEVAFYDALEVNDSAVQVLGDDKLRLIAQELVDAVRKSVTIDWTVRENVRAQMRVIIKRILRKYGYPPDKQARATELVLEQAEVLCKDWAA